MKTIFRVVAQQEPFTVQKADGTTLSKCIIVLQEFGGRYENSYVCTLLGNAALTKFSADDIVIANLRFQHSEYQGKFFNDIIVRDIYNLVPKPF